MLANRLMDVLNDNAVGFELIHHVPDYSALETAHDTHTAGREFAKAVLVSTPSGPVMAVLPAPYVVDMKRLAQVVGADEVSVMDEGALAELFPDCEVGAEPPFGRLYGLPVYLEASLVAERYLTFNAGSHAEAVRIRFADYERLERPTHAVFAAAR